jgi:hypothetical protein
VIDSPSQYWILCASILYYDGVFPARISLALYCMII